MITEQPGLLMDVLRPQPVMDHGKMNGFRVYPGRNRQAFMRLGLRPGEGEGNVYLLAPYDPGVFYAPMAKGGLPGVCLPQLYADLYHYERRGREQAAHLRREAMGY